jgi:hypothetical protein
VAWFLEEMPVHHGVVIGGQPATAHPHAATDHLSVNRQKLRVDRQVYRAIGT